MFQFFHIKLILQCVYVFFDRLLMDALIDAIKNNNKNIVFDYIISGEQYTDMNGYTPLMYAFRYEELDMCNLLLDAEPDFNVCNKYGHTHLIHACMQNYGQSDYIMGNDTNINKYISVFKRLIDNTPDINAVDASGKSAIWYLTMYCTPYFPAINIAVLDLLLKKGGIINPVWNIPRIYKQVIDENKTKSKSRCIPCNANFVIMEYGKEKCPKCNRISDL